MVRVRALDGTHDWLFGKGVNDYLFSIDAIAQNIDTRLYSFLGDCFFDLGAGIDWFNFLGGKDQTALNLAISAVILNTPNVTGLLQFGTSLDEDSRRFTVSYRVQTAISTTSGIFSLDTNVLG